ncbi:MAG: translation initiation factor IF-2 N-terminal domain-containing protein, partial [Bacteroidota bacterium]|nr:translation initiation factor IF-2 N-terminal domain-containing protein [Bacteroidota bacterium]
MAADTTEKTKKTTVRNLATEINISHDTLIEFLQKKGYTNIKSIMSKVDEDALELVMKQFGKDRDVTEKRQKKVAAFKEKRAISKGEAAVEEPPKAPKKETAKKGEPAAPIQEKEVKAPQEIPAEPILQPEKEISEEEVPAPEAQPIVAEGEPAEGVAETTELGEEHGEESEEAKSKRKRRKKKTTTVLVTGAPEQQSPVQGLKIKGKIDLEALHPKKKEPMQRLDLKKSPKLGKTDGKPKEFEVKTKKALEEEDRSGKKKRGREKSTINAKEVQEAVKRTLFGLDESSAVSGRAKMR